MKTTTLEPKVYWKVCGLLMLLLAVTWGVGYLNLGSFNLIFALAIAITKALLVMLFFMHIRGSSPLLHLAAGAGLLWLLILISLTLGDYMSRGSFSLPH
jgi:cytochrome c oxidase subunit IV